MMLLKRMLRFAKHQMVHNLSWKENIEWVENEPGIEYSTDHNIISNHIQNQNNAPFTTGLVWIDSTNLTNHPRRP